MGFRRAALVLAAVLGVGLTGCGGDDDPSGEKVFKSAGCGNCHTLAAAGSDGTSGPSLDQLGPSEDQVASQVANGSAGMPAFGDRLSDEEIDALAEFVSESADGAGGQAPVTFKPDDTKLEDCEGRGGGCYRQAFGNLAVSAGPRTALGRFARGMGTDRTIEANCHPIAHTIGAGALLHYEGNVGRALADGSPACGSGFYHGLIEWKLASVDERRIEGASRRVCSGDRTRSQAFIYYQCVHGLGHGLMLYTNYDLPGALRVCHRLATGFDQTSCTGGVFMENQSSSYSLTSKWLNEKNLIYPCNIVEDRDKLYCYLLVSSRILPKVEWDWDKAAEWCRKSEPRWVRICFQSYGRDVSGQTRQSPKGIERLCRHAGDMASECLFGGVRDILNNDPDDLAARHLCSALEGVERDYCFEGIGSMVGTRYGENRERIRECRRLAPGGDVSRCVRSSYKAFRPA